MSFHQQRERARIPLTQTPFCSSKRRQTATAPALSARLGQLLITPRHAPRPAAENAFRQRTRRILENRQRSLWTQQLTMPGGETRTSPPPIRVRLSTTTTRSRSTTLVKATLATRRSAMTVARRTEQ